MANQTMPRVLSIDIGEQPDFPQVYGTLMERIRARSIFQRATEPGTALHLLATSSPDIILITDEALAVDYENLWDAVLHSVRRGAIAIAMASFSCWVPFCKVQSFFARAGLPWVAGSFHRATSALNKNADGISSVASRLPAEYIQKALHLEDVANRDAWYLSPENMIVNSWALTPSPINDFEETPAAVAKVGEGKVGYIGDVGNEEETQDVILAMCGLLE